MTSPPAREQVGAVLVAAGESRRMGGVDKVFTPLLGKPLLSYALQTLQSSPRIHAIVLVLNERRLAEGRALLDGWGWGKVVAVGPGGLRRQDSVKRGLDLLPLCDWVVVHDAARPCLDEELLAAGLEAARATGAAIPVVPLMDTIKEMDPRGQVARTLPRERLVAAQTPQVFRRELLVAAHEAVTATVTDDAAMLELLGHQVRTFPGSTANLKVTTPEDLALVEAILTCAKGSAVLRALP